MSNPPPDQQQREEALDPTQSILVQAPAGSGKTDLLTRRFLRLLAEVDEPGQVVAITFTNAAAAEMRHRILAELEKAALRLDEPHQEKNFSMESLAHHALIRSRALGWKIVDLPAQLRITTIDAFCRELALQQPLLTGLGGGLEIAPQPEELYRRAARATLRKIDQANQPVAAAIESLLLWRDNSWQEMEDLLVTMLGQRDRWMREFVLDREPDEEALREQLERPFAAAVRAALIRLDGLFSQMPPAREQALLLARFACTQGGQHRELAEMGSFPYGPYATTELIEEARQAYAHLAELLLTAEGAFRKQVNVRNGFPANCKKEKESFLELVAGLRSIQGLEAELAAVRSLPPARYIDEDWQIVRACFTLLRHAAGELQIAFAETGSVDFVEVAQIDQRVLQGPDGLPTDAALGIADKIRHLLVDEFQDTSRRQHQLLASLIAAWPDREGRTCFAVGDPMQSIYFFRDADAELFSRVKTVGLETPGPDWLRAEPLLFNFVPLQANFRTAPHLVERLNEVFHAVFAVNDGSGITFASAQPARPSCDATAPRCQLHLEFVPHSGRGKSATEAAEQKEAARITQIAEVVTLIHSHQEKIEAARANGEKFRIAVLGRTKSSLIAIAASLRAVQLPFRAVELEKLQERPEVLDALCLARALLQPLNRVAWLGVLRAPWCGLSLAGLHTLTSSDDASLLARPIPELLEERVDLLGSEDRLAAARVLEALQSLPALRTALPTAAVGSWLEQVWLRLGGAACVDAAARANLDLLWSCLDRLPGGEEDLLGPALGEALEKLTALPDPAASSEAGVQLMTIHKSKGLEFEIVIVPDLQARGGGNKGKMLSWLERGLAQPGESGEVTEFLIAPMQPKGAERGKAKEWVDQVYRQRETQEMRRILYVAATRAREELHLFARPAYKEDDEGELSLAAPTGTLLATAWPALEAEVFARFSAWKILFTTKAEDIIDSIAAAGENNLIVLPAPAKPTLLRRLPAEFQLPFSSLNPALDAFNDTNLQERDRSSQAAVEVTQLYSRHQGGLFSRVLGIAVHSLLEEFAHLRTSIDADAARAALPRFVPRIAAEIRARGIDPTQSEQIAADALSAALAATLDPMGDWILAPHAEAASEVRWTGEIAGSLRTVQVDRVFRAGSEPLIPGQECWWIVDYKTADSGALPELRKLFAPQLLAYARMLRKLHGADAPIRAGLFYPRMLLFDCWVL